MTYGNPYLVAGFGSQSESYRRLESVPLRHRDKGAAYDELWLQKLIHNHPSLLPIEQIEGGITEPVAVCMELGLSHGYVDNLLVTPRGDIVVVETKLFRNFESRRKVVAQILDYAMDLAALSYTQLEEKIRQALRAPDFRLFRHVSQDAAPENEGRFVDAVTRNLRLGRMLLLIVGDGIQEEASELTSFLQGHVRLHFTLGLVEMALSRVPGEDQVLVQPRVLAKSIQIERAVIRIEGGGSSAPEIRPTTPSEAQPKTMSEETFYEELAASDPGLPARIKELLAIVEPFGVFPVYTKSLSLKAEAPSGYHYQLGAIGRNGRIDTSSVNYTAENLGRMDLSQQYQDRLAALLPSGSIRQTPQQNSWRIVTTHEQYPAVSGLLDQRDQWVAAIHDYVEAMAQALKQA